MSTYINPLKPESNAYADVPPLVREYLNYTASIRGLSARTVNAYYIDLRTFFAFLLVHRGMLAKDALPEPTQMAAIDASFIAAIDKAEIYEFLFYATKDRSNASATRARKLSTLKGFFKYLTSKTNHLDKNPTQDVEAPKIKKSLPKYLTLDESMELLNNIQSDFLERDYCIITLFLNCGMRVAELTAINSNDIKNDTLRILGKGNKERMVYLNTACLQAIDNLLREKNKIEKLVDKQALFVSKRTGKRLSVRRIQQIVNDCLNTAGLSGKGYSAHKLRHTAATLMYQYGHVDMLALKEILGHANVSTTQIYTHLDTRTLREAAASSPLANVKADKQED